MSENIPGNSFIDASSSSLSTDIFEEKNAAPQSKTPSSTRPKILSFRGESTKSTTNRLEKRAIETQTDWSWIQDQQFIQKIKKESLHLYEEILRENNSEMNSDDENISELSSMSEKNGNNNVNSRRFSMVSKQLSSITIDSVGPPKILQYKAETKRLDLLDNRSDSSVSVQSQSVGDLGQFMMDFNVFIDGGNVCEFCCATTKPWPSIRDQENMSNINELYCCNDYHEFVECLIEYQLEKSKISEKMIATEKERKNENARRLAKDRAEYRKIQLLLEKKKRLERLANKKLHEQQQLQEGANQKSGRDTQKTRATSSEDEITRDIRDQVTGQVRSINYQLSNLKYIQQGWTVRSKSVIDMAEMNLEEVEFNIFSTQIPEFDASIKTIQERPLLVKKYKDERICLILFPDGSGSVFYPNGRLAISMSLICTGMITMSVFSDEENAKLLAIFDPFGNACANYSSGMIRLLLSPLGGLELDSEGFRRKRWFWWNFEEHVHAPPLQPLTMSLNPNISVKVLDQEKINLCFSADNQNLKFGVGSKIRISKSELPLTVLRYDPNELYLKQKRKRILEILKVLNDDSQSNILRLPKINCNSSTPRLKQSPDIFKLTQEKKDNELKQSLSKINS